MNVLNTGLPRSIYAQNSALYDRDCPNSIQLSRLGLGDRAFDKCSQQITKILSDRPQHPIQSHTRTHGPIAFLSIRMEVSPEVNGLPLCCIKFSYDRSLICF